MTYACLVVEDSPMMRKLLVHAVGRIPGISTEEAEHGFEALRRLKQTRFDLVITDINMPIMDGLKLVKHLRADPRHADVPIVIVTTEGKPADRDRALALGANAYITKPLQAREVLDKVRELLEL